MTNKETIRRNIGLTFDFVHYLMDHPEIMQSLPDKFRIEFVEKDFVKIENGYKTPMRSKMPLKYVKVKNEFEVVQ